MENSDSYTIFQISQLHVYFFKWCLLKILDRLVAEKVTEHMKDLINQAAWIYGKVINTIKSD